MAAPARSWFDGRARLVPLRAVEDERGTLLPLDFSDLPFVPQRVFTVSDVPAETTRGGHGHRYGQQLLVCLAGRVEATLVANGERHVVTLEPRGPGLLVSAGIWSEQRYAAPGTMLLVLCSEPYDANAYLRDALCS